MAEEAVLKYLESTNRPYSANDIVLNLHKQWGKTGIQRALDSLVAASKVIEKVYGKQKVYVIRQPDENSTTSSDTMKEIDEQIETLMPQLKTIEDTLKVTENQLKSIMNIPTTEQIEVSIASIKKDIEDMNEKLNTMSEKGNEPVSPERLKVAKEEYAKASKEYRTRKRMCMDIVNVFLENYPKSKNDLFEELGIETDEEVGFIFEDLTK